jgi:hypothetical protein
VFSRKPLLFKLFTGLTIKEFDDIYYKGMAKRHGRHETNLLSKRKDRERSIGAGRLYNLDVKNRFMTLFAYYRLHITHTLTGFLFDLDQSNIWRDIQKIEQLVRKCVPVPQKKHKTTKRVSTPKEVERHFPGFLPFTDCTEQRMPLPEKKEGNVIFRQEEKTYRKDASYG